MRPVTYKTIKLSRGKHRSPDEGACVMELASMIAGEPFSDHPESVCPVIGSFLRSYNDTVGDARREDLYRYAAVVVGTRASAQVQQARAEHLALWCSERLRRRYAEFLPGVLARAVARLMRPPAGIDALGSAAVRSLGAHDDETHAAALALVEQLVAIGGRAEPEPDAPAEFAYVRLPDLVADAQAV